MPILSSTRCHPKADALSSRFVNMSTTTHGMHSARRLVTAAAGLALVLTAAPTRALHGQVTDTAKRPPWDLPPSPPNNGSTQAAGQAVADSAYIREAASA